MADPARQRIIIAALTLSATAFGGLVMHEGYTDAAVIPVKGDVPTVGFGTTEGVKMGDKITPPQAVARAISDIQRYEGAVKKCVFVPLYQYEYDAYISLSYNIGTGGFCGSTLAKELNAGHYEAACKQILAWDKFKGQPLRGLTIRRQAEFKQCSGS